MARARITQKDLEAVVARLNRLTGSPEKPYVRDEKGSLYDAQGKSLSTGNYHLSYAYGGVSLHRVCSSGGINDVFRCGHIPKRDLYEKMHSFISGIHDEKDRAGTPSAE